VDSEELLRKAPAASDPIARALVRSRTEAALFGDVPAAVKVGRFTILERVGAGGMGVVWSAWDPELDRAVALKLATSGDDAARARARAEGQALAKLSHPHVVPIYDVLDAPEGVFLVIEMVRGKTLREFAKDSTVAALVRAYRQAGEGLQAAHAEGLVHRDFKPDNAIVGADGRVRVLDFGLAHVEGTQSPISGTRAYMAPEQQQPGPVTTSVDQYALCVSLREALGDNIPRWIEPILRRGTDEDPANRFPSMTALVQALGLDPATRWRRRAFVGLGVTIAAVTGALVMRGATEQEDAVCIGGDERVATAWNDTHRAAVRAAVLASNKVGAPENFEVVAARLDAYAGAWAAMYRTTCEATHKTKIQSEALLDLGMSCLDRRRAELASLVSILERADPEAIAAAPRAVNALSRIETCADRDALLAPVPVPANPGARATVDGLETRLAGNRALGLAGKYRAQLAELDEIVREAKVAAYAPTLAHALFQQAKTLDNLSEFQRAADVMIEAGYAADAGGDRALAANARAELVWLVGHNLGKHDRAFEYQRDAAARIQGLGGALEIEAQLAANASQLLMDTGRTIESIKQDERVVQLRTQVFGPDDVMTGISINNVGVGYTRTGRPTDALPLYKRAAEIYRARVGEHHRLYAHTLFNIASTEIDIGRLADAKLHAARSRELLVETVGTAHNLIASVDNVIGMIAFAEGRVEEASRAFEAAAALSTKLRGAEHLYTANYVLAYATTLRVLGRVDEASANASRALATFDKMDNRAMRGRAHTELSEIAAARKQVALGLREGELAVTLLEGSPPEDPQGLHTARFALAKRLVESPTAGAQDRTRARDLVTRSLAEMPESSLDRRDLAAWLAEH
jgi:serine/threonine protein kinase